MKISTNQKSFTILHGNYMNKQLKIVVSTCRKMLYKDKRWNGTPITAFPKPQENPDVYHRNQFLPRQIPEGEEVP